MGRQAAGLVFSRPVLPYHEADNLFNPGHFPKKRRNRSADIRYRLSRLLFRATRFVKNDASLVRPYPVILHLLGQHGERRNRRASLFNAATVELGVIPDCFLPFITLNFSRHFAGHRQWRFAAALCCLSQGCSNRHLSAEWSRTSVLCKRAHRT